MKMRNRRNPVLTRGSIVITMNRRLDGWEEREREKSEIDRLG